jgi:hypothetical protein
MPTREEREYYRAGYQDGLKDAQRDIGVDFGGPYFADVQKVKKRTTKRKLSAWNKYVKANAKKPRFRLRSGAPNLKKLGVAFRKTPAGRKKRR